MTGGEAILTLTVSVGGIWSPKFVFALLPVGLDKLDILEAKLRDAHEQIEVLTQKALEAEEFEASRLFSVSSKTACGQNQIVQWDALAPRDIPAHCFRLSEDNRQVTVLKAGMYQVYVRVGGQNNSNGYSLSLQLNAADIAQCPQSEHQNHQNAPQLTEFIRLKDGDVLQIKWGGSSSSSANAKINRFSILLLGK
jgi:hypothetical protein